METTHHEPGSPQDAPRYFKTDITPETVFVAIGQLRKDARDEIDRLIQFLDKTDAYVSRELEEGADDVPCDDDEREASFCGLSAHDGHRMGITDWTDEREGDDVLGGDAEAEPSLGSVNMYTHTDQTRWSAGGSLDLEDEHDGAEPENEHGDGSSGGNVDDEPSLCGVGSHEHQGFGNEYDGELEPYPKDKVSKPRSSRIEQRVTIPDFSVYPTLNGLTPQQKAMVRPRLDGVSLGR
ncbi:hypothetical protein [Tardiphaga sp. P9-11]|uniref:hypothetical protein n=1 Tax=Tardiphaga sp. P9-11 TaxID=2024614 RepID=UPI0011F25CFF|nr:hypothetical protein [Tardiphaga sp. P9-11]KAA0071410.1 hypothetical protein CIW50_26505 [Tardiphaga sp. P9-11]